jgi:hypothetical protein
MTAPEPIELTHPEFATLARELIDAGQTISFIARGSSMWPAMPDGARLRLEPSGGKLRCGDVVCLVSRAGGVLVHRLVHRGETWVQTQGDAVVGPDEQVESRAVLGVVRAQADTPTLRKCAGLAFSMASRAGPASRVFRAALRVSLRTMGWVWRRSKGTKALPQR